MQVPTSAFYDRSAKAMTALSARADTLQTQISTGKKLTAASQDPAGYQRLATLKRDGADDAAYGSNLTLASSLLSGADTALTSMTSQLQRASELALSARNGTQNDASRKASAAELDAIVDSLAALGNTKDARGVPLFGGADGGAAVTKNADGSYGYASAPLTAIPVGDTETVQATETAARVFTGSGTDILAALAAFSTALKAGGDVGAATDSAIDDIAGASDQVSAVQASLGARASRIELTQAQLTSAGVDRESVQTSIENTDITAAITELQKTMTILSATQASFTKLSQLSLFDYLK